MSGSGRPLGETILVLLLVILALAVAGCQTGGSTDRASAQGLTSVPSGGRLVWAGGYAEHIQPIFDRHCLGCHGEERAENGLRLTGYAEVMRGSRYGPVVMPGFSSHSNLVAVVRGTVDPSLRMPPGARRLSDDEVRNLVLWIDAGARPD